MFHGIFVTGTDTGVGKTVVSAALMHRYRGQSRPLRYWKPVQTGIEQDDDTADVVRLSGAGAGSVLERGIRLERPLSPHLAARLAGVSFDVEDLRAMLAGEPAASWIVEGAGGVLVPLNDTECMADLMTALGLPVLVVARSGLGTINHTLLTLHALRTRNISVCGVIMVGTENVENRAAIEHYGGVVVVGELPMMEALSPRALQAWALTSLDVHDKLGSCLA